MPDVSDKFSSDEFKAFNENLIAEFRANAGTVGGMFEGAPLLLLTTTGAKTGRSHVAPLAFTRDDDRLIVIASKGGAHTNPDWYHNLRANPGVTVEIGPEIYPARATVAEGAERQRLFDQMAAQMPNFGDFQRKTTRQLPVVVLERMG